MRLFYNRELEDGTNFQEYLLVDVKPKEKREEMREPLRGKMKDERVGEYGDGPRLLDHAGSELSTAMKAASVTSAHTARI